MRKNLDKQAIISLVSILVVISLIVAAGLSHAHQPPAPTLMTEVVEVTGVEQAAQTSTPEPDPDAQFKQILDGTMQQLATQESVDANLLDELHSGAYTFENPLVVVNPYNISPLTAIAVFTTAEPENITIHIEGVDALTRVDYTFDGYHTDHMIPIYGLYPDRSNQVTLEAVDQQGGRHHVDLQVQTEPLPQELRDVIILTDLSKPDQIQPGMNFTYFNGGRYTKSAFDVHGTYRWYLTNYYNMTSVVYSNDHFILVQGEVGSGKLPLWRVIITEVNELGRIYRVFYATYGIHHDIEEYQGNLLLTGQQGQTKEDFIYEIDYNTGQIVNALDLKTVLQRSRQAGYYPVENPDWFHLNAITWDKSDNHIIISGRHQSVVAKMAWPGGKLDWILAPDYGWLPMFDQYLLTPLGNNFEYSYNQHAPEIMPDQDANPDTIDILLFDNGNQRFAVDPEIQRQIRANEIPTPELYSRMVQYRINEVQKTVQQIWQFGKEFGTTLFSAAHGEAILLPNGNRLGVFDVEPEPHNDTKNNGTFFEVTSNSTIVWSAQAISGYPSGVQVEYKLDRMPIYRADANTLNIGGPVINLIPEEVLNYFGY